MAETHSNNTVCCIGTGPSLSMRQVDVAREKGFRLFGCNNVVFDVPDLELLYACNLNWWEEYYWRINEHPCEKWTSNPIAPITFPEVRHIYERWGMGLCETPGLINHGHGSGYSLVGMAHEMGAKRIILLGYDLKYAPDYDGQNRNIGSTPRHYFDEYPPHLQHWPSKRVEGGVHVELLELYQSVADQGLVEVINCSADTALECFPRMPIEEVDGGLTHLPAHDDEAT